MNPTNLRNLPTQAPCARAVAFSSSFMTRHLSSPAIAGVASPQ